jgi:hypothetical protein
MELKQLDRITFDPAIMGATLLSVLDAARDTLQQLGEAGRALT